MSPALVAGFAGGLAGPDAPGPLHAPPRAPALAWIKTGSRSRGSPGGPKDRSTVMDGVKTGGEKAQRRSRRCPAGAAGEESVADRYEEAAFIVDFLGICLGVSIRKLSACVTCKVMCKAMQPDLAFH